MTKFKIICLDCKKEHIIDDEEFTNLVRSIEAETSRMASVLHRHKVPVSYKSHDHVVAIVRTLMRCCAAFNPEIYLEEVNEEEDRKFEEMMKANCPGYKKKTETVSNAGTDEGTTNHPEDTKKNKKKKGLVLPIAC